MAMDWQLIDDREHWKVTRAKVPGGWLVRTSSDSQLVGKVFDPQGSHNSPTHVVVLPMPTQTMAFVPDPEHAWDGNSLP